MRNDYDNLLVNPIEQAARNAVAAQNPNPGLQDVLDRVVKTQENFQKWGVAPMMAKGIATMRDVVVSGSEPVGSQRTAYSLMQAKDPIRRPGSQKPARGPKLTH
ncbi:MAG: hypothetical protein ABTQ34_01905 [Bdellovibrionales bacterium]